MSSPEGVTRRGILKAGTAAIAAGSVALTQNTGRGKPPPNQPDAIFIGAGINSLAAAILLSKAGWRVLIVDRNQVPGGAVRTMELTLPGFRHDIGAMNLTVFANSQFYRDHQADLARHGVEFITAQRSFGSVAEDGQFLGITTDHEANLHSIARFSQADADAWQEWNADFVRCSPVLFKLFGGAAPPSQPLEYLFGKGIDVPADARPALRGILVDSLRHNLTSRFESEIVPALIAAWGMHLDYAPDIAGGCWMPFLETNVDEQIGISLVKGGSGNVTTALAKLLADVGGELRTDQSVDEILFEHGRAVGIRLVGGETIRCSKAVVASVTPTSLLKMTSGQLPQARIRDAQAWKFGPGTMVIHLALSDLPNWRAGANARESFYVHVGPSLDYLAAAYQEGVAGLLSAEPFCVVGQPTAYDPSRAPAGKHVLWVMVRSVPATILGDAAGNIHGTDWNDQVKREFADRVLVLIERHAPGFRELILGQAIISPTELEGLNPNLVGGDLNAGSMHLSQFYGRRPFDDASRSPAPGLYMCGASTWPGGGANTGSGVLLAQELLADR